MLQKLKKTMTSTSLSSKCGHTSYGGKDEPLEKNDDEPNWEEFYECWELSHMGDTDIDLHY